MCAARALSSDENELAERAYLADQLYNSDAEEDDYSDDDVIRTWIERVPFWQGPVAWQSMLKTYPGVKERLNMYNLANLLECCKLPINQPKFTYPMICAQITSIIKGLPDEQHLAIHLHDPTGSYTYILYIIS